MTATLYRGYSAQIYFDAEDGIFFGRIMDVPDIVGFHSDSLEKVEIIFRETVDDYIETREQLQW